MHDSSSSDHSKQIDSRTKLFWRYFLTLFLTFSILFVLGFSFWYQANISKNKQAEIHQSSVMLKFHAELIHKEISAIVGDLQVLSSLPLFEKSMNLSEQNKVREELGHTYLAFMSSREMYDQLRFIDLDGNERVRVDRQDKGVFVANQKSLQNKSNRYYFQEARKLKPGEVYISRLDLNIENGLVEIPFKPMIRLAVMLYKQNEQGVNMPKGMIVVNYLAENILFLLENNNAHTFFKEHSKGLMLADNFGYWLEAHAIDKEWGFMFNRPQQNIKNQIPELWQALQTTNQGVIENEEGIYNFRFVSAILLTLNAGDRLQETFSLVPSQQVGKEYGWYLIDFYPHEVFRNAVIESLGENHIYWILVWVMGALLSGFIAFYWANRRLISQKIHYLAYHDGLTGVYSRSAWNQQLIPKLENWINQNKSFSVAYLDVNDFKRINDELGHEIGDEILKITSQRLMGAIRSGDSVVRLGGDEFLVIFASEELIQDAQFLSVKMKSIFTKPVKVKQHSLKVSVSVGLASFPEDAGEVNVLLSKADERMYKDKGFMKQAVELVSDNKKIALFRSFGPLQVCV